MMLTLCASIRIPNRVPRVAKFDRHWKAGDRVELTLPIRLTTESLPDAPTEESLLYGSIVLAGQFPLGTIDFDLQHNQGPEIQEAPSAVVPALQSKGLPVEKWKRDYIEAT